MFSAAKLLPFLVLVLSLAAAAPTSAQGAERCQYILGFKALHAADPGFVGDCIDDETALADGHTVQHTTRGVLVWQKTDNVAAFTDGSHSLVSGPLGYLTRANTERFAWEAELAPSDVIIPAPGRIGSPSAYPNPGLTPGVADPDVTPENIDSTICKPKYTDTVRPSTTYTNRIKQLQIGQYGYEDRNLSDYEEDHFISLEIGGEPTDPRNLWPQPYSGEYGARRKDVAETFLKNQVCDGALTLRQAQQAVVADWVAVYQHRAHGVEPGSPEP